MAEEEESCKAGAGVHILLLASQWRGSRDKECRWSLETESSLGLKANKEMEASALGNKELSSAHCLNASGRRFLSGASG